MQDYPINEYREALHSCDLCPRSCNANRLKGNGGYCKSGSGFEISSIVAHLGEEPVLSGENGICNVFFARCNLECLFCQNHQISCRTNALYREMNLEEVVGQIEAILDTGINRVGFVSAGHVVPQIKMIISEIRKRGRAPFFVYNSNGYDKPGTLKSLDGFIDIYLPDFKYMDNQLAQSISDVPNYAEVAGLAIKEMYRQKGTYLALDEEGLAESGLIIRHLVIPQQLRNSVAVMEFIAHEISANIHISLMSQYMPNEKVRHHGFLKNRVSPNEYQQVIDKMESLGMYKGWIQDISSAENYFPDFEKEHPFE